MKRLLVGAALIVATASPLEALPRPPFETVFIVVLENATYASALAQPVMADLAGRGALFSNFFAETHPSFPNYVALTAGSTFGIASNATVTLDVTHVGDLVEAAGRTWKVYAEGYPGGCFLGASAGAYVRRHVPFLSFANVQGNPARCALIVEASALAADVASGTLPDYALYIPDLNHDGHDTGVAVAAQWLGQTFGPLLDDPRFTRGRLFVVTFDEAPSGGPNHIFTAVLGRGVMPGAVSPTLYDHYSLLRTIEQALELGSLGRQDVVSPPITDVWRHLVAFADVPSSHLFWPWIQGLVEAGVTGGCVANPPAYCPDAPVSRGQGAVLLLRALHGAGYAPPPAEGMFADVPVTHPLAPWIEQLAREGIAGGCGASPVRFCPDAAVTRGQAAILLLRAVHGREYAPPVATGTFADVPSTHPLAPWIEDLARSGVTGGCGASPLRYCPDVAVTRGQVAVLLVRAFGLPF